MGRAAFNVLVIPYKKVNNDYLYCIFKRSDYGELWQWIAGGGENNETPEEAAVRESFEEAEIDGESEFYRLDSTATVPKYHFKLGESDNEDLFVIPEYSFGVNTIKEIKISHEHTDYQWVNYETTMEKLNWDSNKTALWELDQRLKKGKIKI